MSALTEQLVMIAQQARELPHGQKTPFYDRWARQLCMSRATLLKKLKGVAMSNSRKRRSDAGQCALELSEARLISAVLMEMIRRNNKRNGTIKAVVKLLREDGKIRAEKFDKSTGELTPLSDDAIARALRNYRLHPDQLLAPPPAIAQRSAHPNHVWQVDASISAQFYMDVHGSEAIDPAQYYDGKPENLKKIERKRLWRYVITDHTSGTLYLEYVLGAESAENLINVFINAMQKQREDPFHGVPFILVTDPGAAMKSAMFRNLCRSLSVDLIINEVGNARAKGQVEQAHDMVEKLFESRLAIQKANSLDEINQLAWRWMRHFNATATHTRTGMSRYSKWMEIQPDQLRLAPGGELCRELAVSDPETRVVDNYVQISFRGKQFDVSSVPDIGVGQELMVVRNPWRDEDTAQIVLRDEHGREIFHVVEAVERDDHGFNVNAAMIGSEYKRHATTTGEEQRQQLEQIATGTTSIAEAEAARKAKRRVFADINPHADVEAYNPTDFMPKRGTALDVHTPRLVTKPLTHVEAAKLLRDRLGSCWKGAEHFGWLKATYPDGVPSEEIDAIEALLRQPKANLKLVGGA
ncbi:DDE-type integrase/transposase/recombinase [Marinobacterium litorale]|uniref:DDE-type integrase/transposase/recombinase n=1 Tax=Marinobacterium litorale TaxID=404770 RepID=UPI000402E903|nr:DDE-type integrase/transposase/recombinase [Marinobacterium litorale]